MDQFNFALGDVVLAEWEDKLFYAKIQKIDSHDHKCILIFDDDSVEECPFSRIHSVTETTAEIVCIICKDGSSSRPNEIVLCDKCGIGYHQNCHEPNIPASALEFDAPWMCVYCTVGEVCPYLTNPFEARPSKRGSKRRRLETVRGENCVSSGYSTEEEGVNTKQNKDSVLPDMSGFYYTTQQHHRDGPKPRGRPPFSPKAAKSLVERRGRGVGRPPGRTSTVCDRDLHEEHGYDLERKNHSQHYRQGDMPRQGRYGSPNRVPKRTEEIDADKVPTAPRNSPSKTLVANEETSAAAKLAKMQRRDAPREKQRLTQDLARQKRLLSEDIARAQLLHREQLSKKLETAEKKEQASEREDLSDLSKEELQLFSHIHEDTRKEKVTTMYEKVYGRLSPDMSAEMVKDRAHFEEMLAEVQRKDKNLNYNQERKSLFERFKMAKERVQEMKNIEFVNEAKVEVRGMNCSLQDNGNGIVDTSATQKLEPLKFENVTDDELFPSDNDSGEKPVNCSTFGAVNGELGKAQSNHDNKNMLHFLDKNSGNAHERENNIQCNSERDINDADLNQQSIFENIDCMTCECADSEAAVGEVEGHKDLFSDGDKSFTSELKGNPDHSNIKIGSKIEQLLEEPDMQCEHSSKHCDETGDANSDQFQENGTESDARRDFSDTVDSTAGAQMESNVDHNESKAVTGVESNVSETGMANPVQTQEPTECAHSEENTTESHRADIGTDLSNNEGMSDAEELSDSDVYPAPQRGKVKKRRKRKHKCAKAPVNSPVKASTTSSVLKGRLKGSRSGGRGKKSSRKPKPIQESDSDDTFNYSAKLENSGENLADEEHIPYQGHMVKEDSSSDPPPVLFEDSADIKETFDTALANSCNSKRDTDSKAALEDKSSLKDDEEKEESMEEFDKNSKTDQEFSPTISEHHNSAGEAGDSGQDIFSLTSAERQLFEEQDKKEKMRKEKRIAARQKRRNDEQKEKERSTPPHLVSQNRFARDLPRHNWLVERLLQQNRLCEDTLGEDSATNNDGQAVKGNEDITTAENDDKEEKSDINEVAQSTDEFLKPEQEKQSEVGDSTDEDSSSPKDEFQTELHRSFLRRRYPVNVPRGPPKLKPATPDCGKISESGPPPLNSLKHKLLSPKDCPTMEPIPKLRRINDDGDKSDSSADTVKIESRLDSDANQPQNEDLEKIEEPNSNEKESLLNDITPIEVLNSDDEEEKKNDGSESTKYPGEELSREETRSESKTSETDSKENVCSPTARESFSFSSPKKSLPQKMVNSVTPTIQSNKPKDVHSPKDKLSPSMHVSPHHRAAILIPLMPMHEGGLPMPPSMGPPSPHMKGYPPRTFAPHLISHSSSALQPPGLFPNSLSPSGRYSANACMHHMHGGLKAGMPCKRDVNCPFHGSTPRGMHSGILGIPSHHAPIPAFSQHSHISEHMPPIFSCEHREGEKVPCTRPDCKPCHAGKESPSPKHRETELGSKANLSPQIPKVVKPIAHVPGKRPPLMLSHLQQLHSSRHPPNIEGYHGDKDRRPQPGLESLLPRNQQKSPDKSIRENATTGFLHMSDKRLFNHPLTLSELNRRREEEEILKSRMGERGPEHRLRPGDFVMPRLSSPPHSTSKSSSIFSPRDSATLLSNRSPPLKEAEMLRRFGREHERALLLPEHLKTGPPRLRSVEDPREMADLRIIAERQRREEIAMREAMLAKENPALLQQIRSTTSPQAKLFAEKTKNPRLVSEQAREGSHARDLELPQARLHPAHGNASIFSLGSPAHALGEFTKNTEEARKGVGRDEQHGFKDTRNPELNPSHRSYRPDDKNAALHELERRQRLDLLNSKEQEKKELVEKERQNRSPSTERERQGERLNVVDRDKSPFRLPAMSPPSLRKDTFADRLLTMDPRGRPQHRVDPRVLSLQELEIHRRREEMRGVEPSHRELLSRMAMSSRGAGPHLLTPFLDRKEGLLEGPEHLRLPLGLRRGSPPCTLPRDFLPMSSSRLVVERLAAAAAQAKPGHLLNEKNKDIPPHLREEMERERERERHRLSLEQLEANRRLLHQELKDKMNPLVFRNEGHPRDREREQRELEVLRTREKLMLERERFYAMERLAEERKRKFSGEPEFQFGVPVRRVSPPIGRPPLDREEYERRKRLKLSSGSPSSTSCIPKHAPPHPQLAAIRTSPGAEGARKEERPPRSSPKTHGPMLPHLREGQDKEDPGDPRMGRARDLEMLLSRGHGVPGGPNGPQIPGGPFFDSRESVWLRERAIRLNQEEMIRKRPLNPSGGMSGFMPPKGGSGPPRGGNEPGRTGKKDEESVNSCSVCKREASFLCSGCQSSWYCSPECQLSAWGAHSRSCGQNQRP